MAQLRIIWKSYWRLLAVWWVSSRVDAFLSLPGQKLGSYRNIGRWESNYAVMYVKVWTLYFGSLLRIIQKMRSQTEMRLFWDTQTT